MNLKAYGELVKPRLTLLAAAMALWGYLMGASPDGGLGPAGALFLAAMLLGSGAAALNQLFERKGDALMKRTAERPLPTGRLREAQVLRYGLFLAAAGLGLLAVTANLLSLGIGAAILISYLVFYTRFKTRTPYSLIVGAVPGALPPVLGWAAATGRLGAEAGVLFLILFTWQLPHFLAISWVHRADYARAGFPVFAHRATTGQKTCRRLFLSSAALFGVSLLPCAIGLTGGAIFCGGVAAQLCFTGVRGQP